MEKQMFVKAGKYCFQSLANTFGSHFILLHNLKTEHVTYNIIELVQCYVLHFCK